MDGAAEVQAWLEPRADEMAALREAIERLGLAAELIELAPSRTLEEPCVLRVDAAPPT